MFVLEREADPRAKRDDPAVLDHEIGLGHFRDAQVAQRSSRGFHGIARRVLPGIPARSNQLGHTLDYPDPDLVSMAQTRRRSLFSCPQ